MSVGAITLSICLPSLNRKTYLLQALQSIIDSPRYLNRVEIIVSNNCSDEDYADVEKYIEFHPCVKYVRLTQRIPVDENMHSLVKRAVGTYVYYLGDDDYFLPGGVDELFEIIDRDEPDLAIMNAFLVNDEGKPRGRHYSSDLRIITDFSTAYTVCGACSTYGAILIKREYLQESLFRAFDGTSHAYACYWAALAMRCENDQDFRLKVLLPENPIVTLRQTKKSYSDYVLDVHFSHMTRWYVTFLGFLGDGEVKQKISAFIEERARHGISARFLAQLKLGGADIRKVRAYPSYRQRRTLSDDAKLTLIEFTPMAVLRFAQKLLALRKRSAL